MTFTNPGTSLLLATGSGNDQINVTGSKPSSSVIVDAGLGTNKITDTTGSVVALVNGTSGNDAIRVTQSTTKALMVYVNNSITTCMGVNGFEIDPQGGVDQITLQGTIPSVLVDGEGTDTVDASGLQGEPYRAQCEKLNRPYHGHSQLHY